MNDIFMCRDHFGAIGNSVEAECHKHWLMQLFIASEESLTIEVDGQRVDGIAVLVNADVMHQFHTGDRIHFTLLINPTSPLGRVLRMGILKENSYGILCDKIAHDLQQQLLKSIRERDYSEFLRKVFSHFSGEDPAGFDSRIEAILNMIDESEDYDMQFASIDTIAKFVDLSESRLSHLFKKETGIPLKSYIVLRKLMKAYDLIFSGENFTNAALTSGFDSSAHFSSTNKRMTGMSAREIISGSRFLKVSV